MRLLIVAVAACAALAGGAGAAGAETRPADVSFHAFLGQSQFGHRKVRFSARDGIAVLAVEGGLGHELPYREWSKYAVPLAAAAGDEVSADFGALGTVSLRFAPSGGTRLPLAHARCRGPQPRRELGTFEGTIALHGTWPRFALGRTSATGTRQRTPSLECEAGFAAPPTLAATVAAGLDPSPKAGVNVEIVSEGEARSSGFFLFHWGTTYAYGDAALVESTPGMAIGSFVSFTGIGQTAIKGFENPAGQLAVTALGATFDADPARPGTWDGPLNFTFAGVGPVAMNGPGSRTRACRRGSPSVYPLDCVGEAAQVLPGGIFDPLGEAAH
jgi:hypothetical protein